MEMPMVDIEAGPFQGRRRRRLTEADRELAEALVAASSELEAAEGRLEQAREARWRAVSIAFEEGIHPLDVARLFGVRRRTARDWYARWREENPDDEG